MINLLDKLDKFIAREIERRSKQIRFYKNRIEVIKEWKIKVLELTLSKNGKVVGISIENANRDKLEKAIENADKVMKYLSPIPLEIGVDENYINKKTFDKNVLDNEKLLSKAEEAINYALEKGKETAGTLYGIVEKIKIWNSEGIEQSDRNSMAYLSIRVFKENSSAHEVSCSRKLEKIDEKVGRYAGELANMTKEAKKVKEGTYDVVLSPLAFSNLISYFSSFSSAFAVDAGFSFLKNKMGKKVANECISIRDSGIERDGIFSRKFDDEGVATRETSIVENGILKNYLHNSTTAKKYGVKTTGNAGIISPVSWNTLVMPGDYNKEEVIDEINGLIITNLWYTRFHNYMTGDFSTVARDIAFYAKNGEILHAVKGIRISDNLERILKNIVALSKEVKQIYWWETENPVFCPYAMVRNARITTA